MTYTVLSDCVVPRGDIVKCAARLGAEIRNVKLSGGLPEQTIGSINELLLEHKVIFFRDQGHLDDAEQERFALRFGSWHLIRRSVRSKVRRQSSSLIPPAPVAAPTCGIPTEPSSMPTPKLRYYEA